MNEQPNALRLADLIDQNLAGAGDAEIAAELRRLHAELIETQAQRSAAFRTIEQLQDENTVLLKALKLFRRYETEAIIGNDIEAMLAYAELQTAARDAIAKAEGTNND